MFADVSATSIIALHDHILAARPLHLEARPRTPVWRAITIVHRCNALLWGDTQCVPHNAQPRGHHDAGNAPRPSYRTPADSPFRTAGCCINDALSRDRLSIQSADDGTAHLRQQAIDTIDLELITRLRRTPPASGARPGSEPPGAVIDRLSIFALKIATVRTELTRPAASPAHAESNRFRLAALLTQRAELAFHLDHLLADAAAGRLTFRLRHPIGSSAKPLTALP